MSRSLGNRYPRFVDFPTPCDFQNLWNGIDRYAAMLIHHPAMHRNDPIVYAAQFTSQAIAILSRTMVYFGCYANARGNMRRQKGSRVAQPLKVSEFLCFAVYAANHAFNGVYQPLLRNLGLTYTQFIVLIVLWERDGRAVGELGDELSLQSNTLTPVLKRLEALKYIKRARDRSDERQVRVHLTEAGRKLQSHALDIVSAVRDATGLQEKQITVLLQEVDRLRTALERARSR